MGTLKETLSILAYGFTEKTPAAGNGKANGMILDHFADAKFWVGRGRPLWADVA